VDRRHAPPSTRRDLLSTRLMPDAPVAYYTLLLRLCYGARVYLHPAYFVYYHPRRAPVLSVAKEFIVMLPVALDFAHDALEFGIFAQLVPVLVALEPGVVVIPYLDRAS